MQANANAPADQQPPQPPPQPQPRRLRENRRHRPRRPRDGDRPTDLSAEGFFDVPRLLVDAAVDAGYPTSAALPAMACLNREFSALVRPPLREAQASLTNLWATMASAANDLREVPRAGPGWTEADRAVRIAALQATVARRAHLLEARLASLVGNNTANLCVKYIKNELGVGDEGEVVHLGMAGFRFRFTRPLLSAMLLRQCQACCGRRCNGSDGGDGGDGGGRPPRRRCILDTEAKSLGGSCFFAVTKGCHLFGLHACWRLISVEIPRRQPRGHDPLMWIRRTATAGVQGAAQLELGHFAAAMLRHAGVARDSDQARAFLDPYGNGSLGRICLDRHPHVLLHLTLAGRLGLSLRAVERAAAEASRTATLLRREEEAVRRLREEHLRGDVVAHVEARGWPDFERTGANVDVDNPVWKEVAELHLPGLDATVRRLVALHDPAAPANAGRRTEISKRQVTWLAAGRRSRSRNVHALQIPQVAELAGRVATLLDVVQPKDRELARPVGPTEDDPDPPPGDALASGRAYTWLGGLFAGDLPGPALAWRACVDSLKNPDEAPHLGFEGFLSSAVIDASSGPITTNEYKARLVAAAHLYDALGTSRCRMSLHDGSDPTQPLSMVWVFALPAFLQLDLQIEPMGIVRLFEHREAEAVHETVLAACALAEAEVGINLGSLLPAAPPARATWNKAFEGTLGLALGADAVRRHRAAKARVEAYVGNVATVLLSHARLRAVGLLFLGITPLGLAAAIGACTLRWRGGWSCNDGGEEVTVDTSPSARLVVRCIQTELDEVLAVARDELAILRSRAEAADDEEPAVDHTL